MRKNALGHCIAVPLFAAVLGCGGSERAGQADPEVAQTPATPGPSAPATWVGSARCLECHPEQQPWETSHHHRAWSAPEAFETGPGGPQVPVVGWVGWDPLRQPLVALEGRIQAHELAWDPAKQEWFGVFADTREPGDRGHWTGPSMTWNTQCAPCHTTNLDVGYDPASHTYATTVGEQGVGCESCHGPGSVHAAGEGAVPVAEPGFDGCVGCHARRADLSPGPLPTESWLDRYAPQLVDLGSAFHADGQVHEEDFEVNAFLGSRMYQQGVRCGDCHDPHSGALVREGDGLCLECHQTHETWAVHDHHEGAVACVDCHMPLTTYMQRHPRRDHGFHLPDPALAAEVGAPDTCTRACHDDREPAWAAAALDGWGVDPDDRPHRKRARAVAAAREGGAQGFEGALALLRSDPHPTWRAVGAGLLGPWADRLEVVQALERAASDPDPLIRFAAVGSLPSGHPAAGRATSDPVRAVRVQGARSLVGQLPPQAPPMEDLRTYLLAHRDQPAVALEWGNWLLASGDRAGLDELERAWRLWPADPMVAHGYAVALASTGQLDQAVPVLEDAVGRRPDDPGLWDALGRARAGIGNTAGGVAALEKAVALDGQASRTWYNLGILRDSAGDQAGALEAWGRAAAADPRDADPMWAAASLEHRRARVAEARRLVAQALERDPTHEGARGLKAQLDALP